jgi:hypothetical protein
MHTKCDERTDGRTGVKEYASRPIVAGAYKYMFDRGYSLIFFVFHLYRFMKCSQES